MQKQRIDAQVAQRAVVLQLLRDDHEECWSRAELERVISEIAPLVVNEALGLLADAGVALVDGELAHASQCARHLDALGLICV